jgi:hypothetical protein
VSTAAPKHTLGKTSTSQWLLPVFWILVGCGFYLGAKQITTAIVQDKHDPGPAAICMLCAAALIILGITQAVQLLLASRSARPTLTSTATTHSDDPQQFNTIQDPTLARRQAFLGVTTIAVYIFAVFQIGFGLATFTFGIVSMKSLGVSWSNTLLATISCIATVYLVFIELLGILLPTGRWDFPF